MKAMVIEPLINAPINEIAVIGLRLLLNNGPKEAVNTPKIMVMRYLGYLATLEKNSPI